MKGEALTLDEVVARALESIVDAVPMIDASQSHLRRVRAESLARSALAAIKAAGFVVVPREPSGGRCRHRSRRHRWLYITTGWQRCAHCGEERFEVAGSTGFSHCFVWPSREIAEETGVADERRRAPKTKFIGAFPVDPAP